MQPCKAYFIEGSASLVHPYSTGWYIGGSVFVPGRSSPIVEIGRFQLQQFIASMKGLAEWFGLVIARLAGYKVRDRSKLIYFLAQSLPQPGQDQRQKCCKSPIKDRRLP